MGRGRLVGSNGGRVGTIGGIVGMGGFVGNSGGSVGKSGGVVPVAAEVGVMRGVAVQTGVEEEEATGEGLAVFVGDGTVEL